MLYSLCKKIIVSVIVIAGCEILLNTKNKNSEYIVPKMLLVDSIKNETNFNFDIENTNWIENLIVPCNGIITSRFGFRNSKISTVSKNHMGIDIGAPKGTDIFAAHDGFVIEAGEIGSYGKCVILKNQNLMTVYAHCSKIVVKEGDFVKQHDKIAEVGMTGNATGNHLHFEVRDNENFINPEDVIEWQ